MAQRLQLPRQAKRQQRRPQQQQQTALHQRHRQQQQARPMWGLLLPGIRQLQPAPPLPSA